jgi:hypothetical protein
LSPHRSDELPGYSLDQAKLERVVCRGLDESQLFAAHTFVAAAKEFGCDVGALAWQAYHFVNQRPSRYAAMRAEFERHEAEARREEALRQLTEAAHRAEVKKLADELRATWERERRNKQLRR